MDGRRNPTCQPRNCYKKCNTLGKCYRLVHCQIGRASCMGGAASVSKSTRAKLPTQGTYNQPSTVQFFRALDCISSEKGFGACFKLPGRQVIWIRVFKSSLWQTAIFTAHVIIFGFKCGSNLPCSCKINFCICRSSRIYQDKPQSSHLMCSTT